MGQNYLDLPKKNMCCGCGSCSQVCPKAVISMEQDEEGFLYPSFNEELCINCGLCTKACPVVNPLSLKQNTLHPIDTCAAKNKNLSIRMVSTSGGVFSVFASYIISLGGCVYGAAYDNDMNVVHTKVSKIEDLHSLRGAKYVQSRILGCYKQIGMDLKAGLFVLFSGTPCQCAGLKSYLMAQHVDMTRFFMIDLVCHGVPSPGIWKDFIKERQKKRPIADFLFRDKKQGWHGANVRVIYKNGKNEKNNSRVNSFANLYFNHYISRPSCGKCVYASLDRCSDITIGDCWGIENAAPEFDDNKGCSLIIITTEKGAELIEHCRQELDIIPINIQKCLQPQLQKPAPVSPVREVFWKDYSEKGFLYVEKKYGGRNIKGFVHCTLSKFVRTFKIRTILKYLRKNK